MGEQGEDQGGRTNIGGRHGSPTVTVALPFSKITTVDSELRASVVELAELVARLARAPQGERASIAAAAEELAARFGDT